MLNLAFLWHMHQPWYQDPQTGVLALPWVRLHACKDYLDMPRLLQEHEKIRAVFNFSPSLLTQIEQYAQGAVDLHLALCLREAEALSEKEASALIGIGFSGLRERMIDPYPRYHELWLKAGRGNPFSPLELRDLQVWSNLSWIDPRWVREQPFLRDLFEKGAGFTEGEKRELLEFQRKLLGEVIPAYRRLEESGQAELSTSPWAHPILPLLSDSDIARKTNPGIRMPAEAFRFPEDAGWHLEAACAEHARRFGRRPRGLWPSEGSLSEAVLPAVSRAGFEWLATDEELLWKSHSSSDRRILYRPYRVPGGERELTLLFRDHLLSDLIGFVYSSWRPEEAARDFLRRLKAVEEASHSASALVLVALDGENAWEAYPQDGEPFLRALDQAISEAPWLRCVGVSEYLKEHPPQERLSSLAPGSWIRGEFSTWIGHEPQNRAWEALLAARRIAGPQESRSLAIAEGSDWFWWLGPEHSSPQDPVFDRLFRQHLKEVYQEAGKTAPPSLDEPFQKSYERKLPVPTGVVRPLLDGEVSSYFEWLAAGEISLTATGSAMARAKPIFDRLWWGCDERHLYLRCDPNFPLPEGVLRVVLQVGRFELALRMEKGLLAPPLLPSAAAPGAACGKILEVSLPLEALGIQRGETVEVAILIEQEGLILERYPEQGSFALFVTPPTVAQEHWSA
ncbi:MAG: glycoside hydrolase [Candidatus Omnitrophica bacterium]|nr:glycoside hydrolase [Candidatus Omnitrophota bacterium]